MELGFSNNLMDYYDPPNYTHYPTPTLFDISSFNQTATLGGGMTLNHETINNQ